MRASYRASDSYETTHYKEPQGLNVSLSSNSRLSTALGPREGTFQSQTLKDSLRNCYPAGPGTNYLERKEGGKERGREGKKDLKKKKSIVLHLTVEKLGHREPMSFPKDNWEVEGLDSSLKLPLPHVCMFVCV